MCKISQQGIDVTSTYPFTEPVTNPYRRNTDWGFRTTVTLNVLKQISFVTTLRSYIETPISWDKRLKDFLGHASESTPVSCGVSSARTRSYCSSFFFNEEIIFLIY